MHHGNIITTKANLILVSLIIVSLTITAFVSFPNVYAKQSGLTVVLKLKYNTKLTDKHPELYDKVRLTIGDRHIYNEYLNLKKMKFPSSIEVKGLKIPEGTKFGVDLNNPDTDDGEQISMKNTKCKCKEVGTIKVP